MRALILLAFLLVVVRPGGAAVTSGSGTVPAGYSPSAGGMVYGVLSYHWSFDDATRVMTIGVDGASVKTGNPNSIAIELSYGGALTSRVALAGNYWGSGLTATTTLPGGPGTFQLTALGLNYYDYSNLRPFGPLTFGLDGSRPKALVKIDNSGSTWSREFTVSQTNGGKTWTQTVVVGGGEILRNVFQPPSDAPLTITEKVYGAAVGVSGDIVATGNRSDFTAWSHTETVTPTMAVDTPEEVEVQGKCPTPNVPAPTGSPEGPSQTWANTTGDTAALSSGGFKEGVQKILDGLKAKDSGGGGGGDNSDIAPDIAGSKNDLDAIKAKFEDEDDSGARRAFGGADSDMLALAGAIQSRVEGMPDLLKDKLPAQPVVTPPGSSPTVEVNLGWDGRQVMVRTFDLSPYSGVITVFRELVLGGLLVLFWFATVRQLRGVVGD